VSEKRNIQDIPVVSEIPKVSAEIKELAQPLTDLVKKKGWKVLDVCGLKWQKSEYESWIASLLFYTICAPEKDQKDLGTDYVGDIAQRLYEEGYNDIFKVGDQYYKIPTKKLVHYMLGVVEC